MGFLRKDHVMGVLEDDKVGTMACYESKQERDIVKFCYDSMEHILDRLPQYRPDNVYEDAKNTNVPGKWIPITERTPEDESYILVSFENYTGLSIARYEEDDEGGRFYPGDEDEAYSKYWIYVNAWMPLPEPYREVTDEENLESRR
jgi:hypothetical protein